MIRITTNLSSLKKKFETVVYLKHQVVLDDTSYNSRSKSACIVDSEKAFDYRELPNNPKRHISVVFLKNHVMQSLKQLFGEEGANCSVDLLKYNSLSRRFLLRCEDKDYVRLRSSLTLASTYEDDTCVYTVHKAAASPFGLLSDGRAYQH